MTKFKVVEETDTLPPLDREDGTSYGWFDRWSVGQTPDGKFTTDYADWEARDLFEMLGKDYKARQIENVLSLPIMSAEYQIVPAAGDSGEAEWLTAYWSADALTGGSQTSLDQIIGLCTSAFYYKRAYFEKIWVKGTGDFEGKFVYGDVAHRPQTTCRILRDKRSGRYAGFEQEPYYMGPEITKPTKYPIQITAKSGRAFVFTHGTRKDPLNGTSDMEVAYWAWKTKQKVLLLWFQFLQSVALPRIVVKAQDDGTSRQIAREVARMKGSGVLPLSMPGGPTSVDVSLLDASGKGADQFMAVIQWLDNAATSSILAGFLDLTSTANTNGQGSYALAKDASDFFLQSLEAKTREIEWQIREQLFAPLIRHNFGPKAKVPYLQFEPLNDIDKETAVTLLQAAMMAPPGGPIPSSFIAGLAEQVSNYLGLDGQSMKEDFQDSFDAAAAQAKAEALATAAPGAGSEVGQQVAGLAGAVSAAQSAVSQGAEPGVENDFRKANEADQQVSAQSQADAQAKHDMLTAHADDALRATTGGRKSLTLKPKR
jgi:hypothetical protein